MAEIFQGKPGYFQGKFVCFLKKSAQSHHFSHAEKKEVTNKKMPACMKLQAGIKYRLRIAAGLE
jgi:hypothetical protein